LELEKEDKSMQQIITETKGITSKIQNLEIKIEQVKQENAKIGGSGSSPTSQYT
jgi:hypothetical protein